MTLITDTKISQIAYQIHNVLPLVILGVLIFFMVQIKFNPRGKKRVAILFWAMGLGIIEAGAFLIFKYTLPDWLLLLPLVIVIPGLYFFRKKAFPYSKTCPGCGKSLNLFEFFMKEECNECSQNQEMD